MEKILEVPLIKQPEGSYYCQIACAQMVLAYYGDTITTEEYVRELKDSVLAEGTESEAIARILAERGYRSTIISRTPTILELFKEGIVQQDFPELDRLSDESTNEFAKRKIFLIKKLIVAGGRYIPQTWSLDDVDRFLERGIPVVVHVAAHIFYDDPTRKGGHAIVVRGKRNNEYLINDPSPRVGEPYFVSAEKIEKSWQARSGRTLVVEKIK